ncbi:MAG: hypothetical protein KC619_09760 [Myxococcales bacterium]|nr:hypothetical protein [Myxococcales bacterium]
MPTHTTRLTEQQWKLVSPTNTDPATTIRDLLASELGVPSADVKVTIPDPDESRIAPHIVEVELSAAADQAFARAHEGYARRHGIEPTTVLGVAVVLEKLIEGAAAAAAHYFPVQIVLDGHLVESVVPPAGSPDAIATKAVATQLASEVGRRGLNGPDAQSFLGRVRAGDTSSMRVEYAKPWTPAGILQLRL